MPPVRIESPLPIEALRRVEPPISPRSEETPRPHRVAAPARSRVVEAPASAATAAAEASASHRGWVRVGGARLAGAQVKVDGVDKGFAPVELELPIAAHNIVVTEPGSGRIVFKKVVRIGDHHTRVTPLRILR